MVFLLNEQVFKKKNFLKNNYFTERMNIWNKRFYWTTNFTEHLLSEKTNEIDGKWTDTINLFLIHWKKMKWIIHEWWTNKMNKKPNTPISTVQIIGYFIGKYLFWESLCKLSVTVDFILSLECCWSFWEIWNLYLLSKFKIFRLNSFNIKKFLL